MSRDEFIEGLRRMLREVEKLSIQCDLYKQLLVLSGVVTLEGMTKLEDAALADSVLIEQAHQRFAELRRIIEEAGTDALFQELLDKLPPTGKPN